MDVNEAILSKVEDNYPWMISQNIFELKQCCFEKAFDQLSQINQIFEVIMKYLTSIVVRNYLYSDGKSNEINAIIRDFKRPSNGKWNELLRECSMHVKEISDDNGEAALRMKNQSPVMLSKRTGSGLHS